MTIKNNALRALEQRRIPYTVHPYDADEFHSGVEVAALIGAEPTQVFKTLVVLPDRGKLVLVVVPAPAELDLKRCAQALSEKRLRMAAHKEAEQLTGLQVGGISALALLGKGFRVCIDHSALQWTTIFVSAGQRGLNVCLAPNDYIAATGAQVAAVTLIQA